MNPDFNKNADGLVPAIIQHASTNQVLMLGYMNEQAWLKTKEEGLVSFYSRSKNRIWTKGETSGNHLKVDQIQLDCDNDTILIHAFPNGPVCHTGQYTCFEEENPKGFLYELERTINSRLKSDDSKSYTNQLFKRGINKIAQKVGEEAVELVIEAKDNDQDLFKGESADLLYHFLILLRAKNLSLKDVEEVLLERHHKSTSN